MQGCPSALLTSKNLKSMLSSKWFLMVTWLNVCEYRLRSHCALKAYHILIDLLPRTATSTTKSTSQCVGSGPHLARTVRSHNPNPEPLHILQTQYRNLMRAATTSCYEDTQDRSEIVSVAIQASKVNQCITHHGFQACLGFARA